MPLKIGDVERKVIRYRWPEVDEIPEEDKAVFVLKEPSPIQYRSLMDRYVTYDVGNQRQVSMKIRNTQLSVDLILMCFENVENVEYNGKPVQITPDNKKNKVLWLLDTNLGLDPAQYGSLIDDLVAVINRELVPAKPGETTEIQIGSDQGN